ncbi:LIM domain protein [Teladorsagia circumcincta]|uniref:LIM domain protein n=1 Tax=Teladorsagia circumcincta TaxID=45464 RepID=A0A2G9TRD4_TELCI|nr:LIM domain protein [Teladorsagia circumcincta]
MPWEVYEPLQCQKFFGSTEIIGDEDTGQHRHGHGHGHAMCSACQQPISSSNPGCTALGQSDEARWPVTQNFELPLDGLPQSTAIFHINCFKCRTCGKTLAGSSFYNIENNPTCGECYNVDGAGCYPLNDHLYCKNCNVKRLRAGQH